VVERLETAELAVVGAGPAGMSAALAACSSGVQVVMLDDQPRPGGQVFRRGVEPRRLPRFASSIDDIYADPSALNIDYRPRHAVWAFDADALHVCGPEGNYRLQAKRTIIATGASEWVLPVPGWTLPGVTTAGGAQALLKSSGVVVGRNVAIAGTGPLLLQLASQLLAAGASIAGIFEVASFRQWAAAVACTLPYPPLALQGLALLATLIRRGIVIQFGCVPTRIHGEGEVNGLDVMRLGEKPETLVHVAADAVCLSYGLVASTELAAMRGCGLRAAPALGAWQVVRDAAMRTTDDTVFAVGDGADIGGARFAICEGTVAGFAVARDLGRVPQGEAVKREREAQRRIKRLAPVRGFLSRTFRARTELIAALPPDAMLCRCEEVRVGAIRNAIRDGVRSLHELRILLRVGMGPCQGRYCTTSALRLLAQETGRTHQELGTGSARPPVRPITIGQI
jgi:NADPH-dependent 2,4-dienoyl-CoA reductase/sulfur reductase-like enzyme